MLNQKVTITIGIPSIGRAQEARKTILALKNLNVNTDFQVLLINNNRNLESYSQVKSIIKSLKNFEYLSYTNNSGFGDSFIKLIDKITTKYLLVLSDEDEIIYNGFEQLIMILNTKKLVYLSLARGEMKRNKEIRIKEIGLKHLFSETIYISGKVINVEYCKKYIPILKELIKKEIYADLYPQVLLAFLLKSEAKIFWSDLEIFKIRASQTRIRGLDAKPYDLPTERVNQFLSLLRCLDYFQQAGFVQNNLNLLICKTLIKLSFFGKLYDSILTIEPRLKYPLLLSAQKTVWMQFFKIIKNLIRNFVKYLFFWMPTFKIH